ncbi:unnamed protein product [Ranitomeya imitator]|uniref:ADP-ribosylation factor-like protein 8A n=1 Tax=Ranitomeya imitator TaxID=111125 RepID=A0ABN9MAC7_9NEOB|nr:unnamed protein product [Ranitomeya imitator]
MMRRSESLNPQTIGHYDQISHFLRAVADEDRQPPSRGPAAPELRTGTPEQRTGSQCAPPFGSRRRCHPPSRPPLSVLEEGQGWVPLLAPPTPHTPGIAAPITARTVQAAAGRGLWIVSCPPRSATIMLALFNKLLDWFKALFWKEEMELTLVGLQYSGKTTFVNVIASGQFNEDMIPTVGFNMRKITKGNVTIKLWDIGGQPRFRSMWERYCRDIWWMLQIKKKLRPQKNELHNLLDKAQLQGIPVLVLGNKRDIAGALDEKELIERMNLSAIQDREICCYSISCKEKDNIGSPRLLEGNASLMKYLSHVEIQRSCILYV